MRKMPRTGHGLLEQFSLKPIEGTENPLQRNPKPPSKGTLNPLKGQGAILKPSFDQLLRIWPRHVGLFREFRVPLRVPIRVPLGVIFGFSTPFKGCCDLCRNIPDAKLYGLGIASDVALA